MEEYLYDNTRFERASEVDMTLVMYIVERRLRLYETKLADQIQQIDFVVEKTLVAV